MSKTLKAFTIATAVAIGGSLAAPVAGNFVAAPAMADLLPVSKANEKFAAVTKQYEVRWAAIDAKYDPVLTDIANQIAAAEKAGLDLDNVTYVYDDKRYGIRDAETLVKYLKSTDRANTNKWYREQGGIIAADRDNELERGKDLQTVAEVLTLPTNLLGQLIGRPGLTRVDTYQITDGRPLGGDTALIPKARQDIGKIVGVDLNKDNGFVGNAIKNPTQPWKW